MNSTKLLNPRRGARPEASLHCSLSTPGTPDQTMARELVLRLEHGRLALAEENELNVLGEIGSM